MKRGGILNIELSNLISGLRHGHCIMITDVGFPTPCNVPIIDLALTKGIPSIDMVLKLLDSEMVTEKIIYAKELRENNPKLHKKVIDIFEDADSQEVLHTELVEKYGPTMRCFVHTGEYSPWGNIILVSGTDPFLWFEEESTVVPEFYHKRLKQIRGSSKLDLFDQSNFTRKDC